MAWVTFDEVKGKYPISRQQLRLWARSGKVNYILLPSGHFKYDISNIAEIFAKAESDAAARSKKE
jgi:predicted site-specific integrase-resolvase